MMKVIWSPLWQPLSEVISFKYVNVKLFLFICVVAVGVLIPHKGELFVLVIIHLIHVSHMVFIKVKVV
jgi:hypothetical protein